MYVNNYLCANLRVDKNSAAKGLTAQFCIIFTLEKNDKYNFTFITLLLKNLFYLKFILVKIICK